MYCLTSSDADYLNHKLFKFAKSWKFEWYITISERGICNADILYFIISVCFVILLKPLALFCCLLLPGKCAQS